MKNSSGKHRWRDTGRGDRQCTRCGAIDCSSAGEMQCGALLPTKECHHCGHKWKSRKERPKKCPQCQNPLWKSDKPKRKTRTAPSETAATVPQEIATSTPEAQSDACGAEEAGIAKLANAADLNSARAETLPESSNLSPGTNFDPIQEAKAKAEELLRRLNAPSD